MSRWLVRFWYRRTLRWRWALDHEHMLPSGDRRALR